MGPVFFGIRLLVSQLPVDSCNKTIDEPVHQVEDIFGYRKISRLIPNLEIDFQFEQRRQRPKKRKISLVELQVNDRDRPDRILFIFPRKRGLQV